MSIKLKYFLYKSNNLIIDDGTIIDSSSPHR